ncbi:MAG: translation elongation factor Ts [Bacteroidota bacterium]|nr:translation elongation factor Ts [Bacteroidota bacterium]
MADIKASDVAKLRKMTGAGMMDCKNALVETNGDFDQAIDILRKKGQKIASKRADRDATEGSVIAVTSSDNKKGVIIVLNCETDFVAKNTDYVNFATKIANTALGEMPADLSALKALVLDGKTVEEEVTIQSGIIGEKVDLSFYAKVEAPHVVGYIHPGNKLATLVGLNQENIEEQVGKDVAMQVAAMSPVSVNKDDVPADIVAKELEIGREIAIQEGKPEKLIDKIAEGKLNKFFKENTLLSQQFIKDNKTSVADYLNQASKGLTVTEFVRFSLNV